MKATGPSTGSMVVLSVWLAIGSIATGQWAAYNDCVYETGQYLGSNVTTYGVGDGFTGATGGELVNQADGSPTGVTVALTQSGGVGWQPDSQYSGGDCAEGTDAHNTFGGLADMTGVLTYGQAGWFVEITFTGLQPGARYTFAASAARNEYVGRLTVYTILGADTYTNASTPGADVLGEDKVRFDTGGNHEQGYVARWTDITAADGTFTVRAEADPSSPDGLKAYSFDVFMLRRDADPEPAGDLNGDDRIDLADLLIFGGLWLTNPGQAADLNADGRVDMLDLAMLSGHWLADWQAGALQVNITPAEAVAAGAQWSLDGQTWHDAGQTVPDLPIGPYIVHFRDLSGWNQPNDLPVEVVYDDTIVVDAQYVLRAGTVQVILEPAEVRDAGAQWSLDGATWYDSGHTTEPLAVGEYTVMFAAVEGWTTPQEATITVTEGQATLVTGTYERQTGSLTVTIDPAEVRDQARWSLDGKVWYESGQTLDGLGVGAYTVQFAAVDGWETPAPQEVTILYGQMSPVYATYSRQFGRLTVLIEPQEARADARWSLDGSTWHTHGETLESVPVGTYTLQFGPVAGYNAPASRPVTISDGGELTETGVYALRVGSLTVTIEPGEAVAAGAQWSLNGQTWHDSGATLAALPVGPYTITFKGVSGWDRPADVPVTLVDGAHESRTGTYTRQFGALTVVLDPAEVRTEARWSINGDTWHTSGETIDPLAAGNYTVQFNAVTGWVTPPERTVTVLKDQTTSITAAYAQQAGSLTVSIAPAEAVAAGAQWSIDGTTWYDGGHTLDPLAIGSYTVRFSTLAGWTTPDDVPVTITSGQNTTTGGTYILQTGSLTVHIEPVEAVAAGAQWSLDGTTWHDSGALVSSLPVGSYTIQFNDVAGWDRPAEIPLTLADGALEERTGTYVRQTGSLTVTIEPSEAIAAGAQWSLDGATWHDSGATLAAVPTGAYTIRFRAVDGWDTPADIPVTITDDGAESRTGTYVRQTGSLTVTIEPAGARSAGAQWSLDGATWYGSGHTLSGLPTGPYSVQFSRIDGWTTPTDEAVTVTDGGTAQVVGWYTQQLGALTVTIEPADVRPDAGWSIDGNNWYAHGQTLDNLSLGWYTVQYSEVAGYTRPDDQVVKVEADQTTTTSGLYVLQQPAAALILSEFMADNDTTGTDHEFLDEDGEESDWIEIYNPTAETVSLLGYALEDDNNRWVFPDVSMDSGAFLVVFASGKDRRTPGFELHTNFALSRGGERLVLVGPDGSTVVDAYDPYPAQLSNISYGVSQFAMRLIKEGDAITYRVPTAADAGPDWTSPAFDDSAWADGQVAIGFTTSGGGSGLHYEYFKGNWDWLPDFDALTPAAEGACSNFDITLRDQNDYFAFRFTGFVTVPTDGEYTFYTTSDDGSQLWIGDTLVVNNDGLHGAQEVGGAIELTAGAHPITVTMFEKGGDEVLLVSYAGPGISKMQIPDTALTGGYRTNVQAEMQGVNSSLWLRAEFTIEDPDAYDMLVLNMRYEDGFVAYLNGQEVARRNAAASVLKGSWNAASQTNRPDGESAQFEAINLTAYLPSLLPYPAKNVLAVHGLNDAVNNGEFLLLPELQVAMDTGVEQYFTEPTPGAFNVPGALGLVGDTKFSVDRGFFTSGEAFDLEITCDTPGVQIMYTTDGSTPSATHGTPYTGPIHIDRTTIIRAVATRTGYLSSNVDTQTYLFLEDVIHQSPNGEAPGPGWPGPGWFNNQVFNYGMDPDIVVNDARYAPIIVDALKAVPSLSLVTDLPNLFDPARGIYVNAYNDGRDWERPCSLELIHPDGTKGFQVQAGVRIRGGYSRSGDNPKHAFRLFFRNEYGDGKLYYPLFGEEGADEFDKVDLRTAQNYSWSFGGDSRNTMCREVFSRDTQRAMGQPYTRSRYYHLYINGHYWGLFQTQERSEARFAETYLGGTSDDYDVVKVETSAGYTIQATDGDLNAWQHVYNVAKAGFASHEPYYRLRGLNPDGTPNPAYPTYLDVDNLIDYMICTYFVGDFDGPVSNFLGNNRPNNFYGVFNRNAPDGFKFFRHDAEHSLFDGWDRTGPWPAGEQFEHFNPQWLHQQLTQNLDYRLRFADRVHRHFFGDGVLTPEASRQRLLERVAQIELAIVAESARWGDSKTSSPLNRDDHWWPQINHIVNNYLVTRTDVVLNQFRNQGWYPPVAAPTFSVPTGDLSPGSEVTITNEHGAGTIYYTLDGTDPRVPSAQSSPGGLIALISDATTRYVQVPTQSLAAPKGSVTAQYYFNITDGTIAALKSHPGWPNNPDQTQVLTRFEIPVNWNDRYGTRIAAYVHPIESGNYTFWISSDDHSELWLSPDASAANATRIAYVSGWTNPREWTKFSQQQSAPIPLQAGSMYYIEALMGEGTGGDNLAVAWQRDGTNSPRVIDGMYLSSAGIGWVLPDFDHSSWRSGAGVVGYENNPGDPVNFSDVIDIDVQADMAGQNATCLIRIPFTYDGSDVTGLSLKMRYDDGFIAYLNGTEILRVNFDPTVVPDWNSGASASHDDAAALVPETFDISGSISLLKLGQNLLAIHGLNYGASSSDFLMGVELEAFRLNPGDVSPTAQEYTGPIVLARTRQLKARVLDGTWSALNEATYNVGPVRESLRITEIMYHPAGDPNDEFIEVQNVGSSTINLNLVRFTEGIDFTFGLLDLPAGQLAVVARSTTAFMERYPDFEGILAGQFDGRLDNAGERIRLEDALGREIMDFKYRDGWYEQTDGEGFSLTLRDPYQGQADYPTNGLAAHWRFDEGSGTVAVDSAGGHTGTLQNMAADDWVPGRFGYALDFDGTNDRVRVTGWKGILGTQERTFVAWIKTDAQRAGDIISWGGTSPGRKWLVQIQNTYATPGTLRVDVGSGYVVGGTPLWDGQWHQIAVVLPDDGTPDVSEIRLYVDGRPETVIASVPRAVNTQASADVQMGIFDDGSYRYFQGQMDNLALFDRALSDDEVAMLAGASGRWSDKDQWRPSMPWGGSPGWDDSPWAVDPGSIVINELLAHSHLDAPDWIELHNLTGVDIPLDGWFLSDSDADDAARMKYEIAPGTTLPAGGYLVFYEDVHFGAGATGPGTRHIPFALSEGGEAVYLRSGFGGMVGGFKAEESFDASASGVALGRYVKSALDGGVNFVAMSTNTPGGPNAYPMVGPVLISEIMYHPNDDDPVSPNTGDEYIELYNVTDAPVLLATWVDTEIAPGQTIMELVPWQFTDGIDFVFPPDTTIPARGRLIVARDPAAFTAYYGSMPAGVAVLGPFENDTKLDNAGERLQLSMPGDQEYGQDRYWIRIDRVNYDDEAPWPVEADGLGKSLSQKTPDVAGANYGNDVINWHATDPNPGQ